MLAQMQNPQATILNGIWAQAKTNTSKIRYVPLHVTNFTLGLDVAGFIMVLFFWQHLSFMELTIALLVSIRMFKTHRVAKNSNRQGVPAIWKTP